MDLYSQLGGIQSTPRLAPRGWDHPLGGLVVELDGEQHFNRYRALTLRPDWAKTLPWQESYRLYCDQHERVALAKHSSLSFWTKSGAEAKFSPSGPPGDLGGNGSAQWEQRALYDYDAMRDALAAKGGATLVWVAVYARPVIMHRPDGTERHVRAVWFRQGEVMWRTRAFAAGVGREPKEVGAPLSGRLPFVPVLDQSRLEQKLVAAVWSLISKGDVTESWRVRRDGTPAGAISDTADLTIVGESWHEACRGPST